MKRSGSIYMLMPFALSAVVSLSGCITAGRAFVGTMGTATKVAAGTAGTAAKVAVETAGAAGSAVIGTATIGQSTAGAAASGTANGAAREGGRFAVRGLASAGQAGFRAMTTEDSSVSEATLAHRAGLTLSYPYKDLSIGNVFEEGARTDYTVVSFDGQAANCYVLKERGTVSDALCRPAVSDE